MNIIVTYACYVVQVDHEFTPYCQEGVFRQA